MEWCLIDMYTCIVQHYMILSICRDLMSADGREGSAIDDFGSWAKEFEDH